MAKRFDELADKLKSGWSDDTKSHFDEAAAAYDREIAVRRAMGEAVATARTQAGLTQAALSQASSVQQAEISRIERGHANPTLDTLDRLASAMGRRVSLEPATVEATP